MYVESLIKIMFTLVIAEPLKNALTHENYYLIFE